MDQVIDITTNINRKNKTQMNWFRNKIAKAI